MSQLLFECYWKLVPLMQVCAFWPPVFWQSVAYLNIVLISNAVIASSFCSSSYTRLGVTQMSTDAPFHCYASHHMWSLPSIPENGRGVCIWIRCVNIGQQFSIARNRWSEQQFLQLLTVAELWDVCQFIEVCNHKYKNKTKKVQQMHIGRVMICLTSHSFIIPII